MNGIIPLVLMCLGNLWVCADLATQKNYPMAIVFFAYGLSCAGFIWGYLK